MIDEDDSEFMWLVGWLEGEGCFHSGRKDGVPRFVIEAASIDLEILERVQELVSAGIIREKKSDTSNRLWTWRVDSRSVAIEVVKTLCPYMHSRRRMAMERMIQLDKAEPFRERTHQERSTAAHKMWQTRRARYGKRGAPA